jgi:hypothetical protein
VEIQLKSTASSEKYLPMEGRAILTDDAENGVIKAASVVTNRV